MDNLEHRISQLELNQRRLLVLLNPAPEGHKAWDKACIRHDLTFEQEAHAREAILNFLGSKSTDVDDLLSRVNDVVGNRAIARDLVSAFKQRGTAVERWREIDPNSQF